MYRRLFLLIIATTSLLLLSCKKEAGKGGSSALYGKVKVRDYNTTFTVLQDEFYAQEVRVYIIYGDARGVSDDVRTSYDGSYEFKYLQPGTYHIFAYSKDSTSQTNALIPIIKTIEITKNKQELEVPEIIIID